MIELEVLIDLLPILLPIILLDLGLKIYAIVDLLKPDRKTRGNMIVWLVVVALVNFGWIFYFIFGRDE